MTRRIAIGCALAAALAMPATASAENLTQSDSENASKFCKALRAEMGVTAFRQAFGTNENRRNAHGKCVSRQARAADRDHSSSVEDCRTERDADAAAFEERYGTNRNNRNAFGKCVSQKARELAEERHDAIVNASRQCRTERSEDPDAFRNRYGTNRGKRNAFGKCVSQKARAENPGS